MEPTVIPNNQKRNQTEAKTSQGTFKDTLEEQGWTNIGKGCQKGAGGAGFWEPFLDQLQKNTIQ